jgi:hypothetical protein
MVMTEYVDIVFSGPPGHEDPRFIEVEDDRGQSISFGEWVERPDGYWALRIRKDAVIEEHYIGKKFV